jgi:hypothetical protein
MHLISEPIQVFFDQPPLLEKKPVCPDAFEWREQRYTIVSVVAEWFDFSRRGRMAHNMRISHLNTAQVKGSWGVGRYFFQVEVDGGRVFEIYYDRAPGKAGDRKGSWVLFAERSPASKNEDDL